MFIRKQPVTAVGAQLSKICSFSSCSYANPSFTLVSLLRPYSHSLIYSFTSFLCLFLFISSLLFLFIFISSLLFLPFSSQSLVNSPFSFSPPILSFPVFILSCFFFKITAKHTQTVYEPHQPDCRLGLTCSNRSTDSLKGRGWHTGISALLRTLCPYLVLNRLAYTRRLNVLFYIQWVGLYPIYPDRWDLLLNELCELEFHLDYSNMIFPVLVKHNLNYLKLPYLNLIIT